MKNKSNGIHVTLLDVVQIVFIILKLVGVVNWSWLIVFIPWLASLGLWIVIIILALALDIDLKKYI
jgi:hypothetical protein